VRLAELKERFWDRSSSYGVFDPLTEAKVAEAEAALGVKLPSAYLELLRVQNGGSVSSEFDAYPTSAPTSWAKDHVPLDSLMGIGETGRWTSILDSPYFNAEWEMPEELVLLSGDGHYWVALDYRTGGPQRDPSIVWIDNEVDEDIQVAPDFLTFVEGLRPSATFPVD
jgi:SMI1/KNR4 family protein SUKH-1